MPSQCEPGQACPSQNIFTSSFNQTQGNSTTWAYPTVDSTGTVNAVSVFPCERGQVDEPCRFRNGVNYMSSEFLSCSLWGI